MAAFTRAGSSFILAEGEAPGPGEEVVTEDDGGSDGPVVTQNSFQIDNPIKWDNFEDVINAIIDFIFWVAILVAPIMFLIAGFNFVTSGGKPDQVKSARNMMIYTAVGLIIIMLSKGIVTLIKNVFGVEEEPAAPSSFKTLIMCVSYLNFKRNIFKGRFLK